MKNIKENISEYIIEMYRKEDLVRAFEFDLEKIGNYVINHMPISNIEKLQQVNYYESLIKKMQSQNLIEEGHLKEIDQLVQELSDISDGLKKSDKKYLEIYEKAKSAINQNLELSEGKFANEVQICLNGIYGFLLLKLHGKKISESDRKSVELFGDLLSYLSFHYAKNSN